MCRVIGATAIPRATSRVTSASVNGVRPRPSRRCRGGRRRTGTPRAGSGGQVAVGDRPPVPVEQRPQVALDRARQSRLPEPVGEESRRVRRPASPAAHPRRSSRRRSRRGSGRRRRARYAAPRPSVRRRAGRPRAARSARRADGVDLGVDGRGVVHDDEVAGFEQVGQVRGSGGARCRRARDSSRTSSRDAPRTSGGAGRWTPGTVEPDSRVLGQRRHAVPPPARRCRRRRSGRTADAGRRSESSRARRSRAAAGRRCPRRGRRPAAWGCACRRGPRRTSPSRSPRRT